jgi:hypothetical protein
LGGKTRTLLLSIIPQPAHQDNATRDTSKWRHPENHDEPLDLRALAIFRVVCRTQERQKKSSRKHFRSYPLVPLNALLMGKNTRKSSIFYVRMFHYD